MRQLAAMQWRPRASDFEGPVLGRFGRTLKSAVTSLQKTVEQLQATQKATGDKKPATK
jgi:hypothetical protein